MGDDNQDRGGEVEGLQKGISIECRQIFHIRKEIIYDYSQSTQYPAHAASS